MTTATDEVRAALERLRSLVVGCEMQAGPSAFVVVQCVDLKAALDELAARAERAEAALRLFLADERFVVQVGGNPIAVEEMLAQATAALEGRK